MKSKHYANKKKHTFKFHTMATLKYVYHGRRTTEISNRYFLHHICEPWNFSRIYHKIVNFCEFFTPVLFHFLKFEAFYFSFALYVSYFAAFEFPKCFWYEE